MNGRPGSCPSMGIEASGQGRLQGGTGLRLSPAENRGGMFFSSTSDYCYILYYISIFYFYIILYQADYLMKCLDSFDSELGPFQM